MQNAILNPLLLLQTFQDYWATLNVDFVVSTQTITHAFTTLVTLTYRGPIGTTDSTTLAPARELSDSPK